MNDTEVGHDPSISSGDQRLSATKRALLEKLKGRKLAIDGRKCAIPRRSDQFLQVAPLTFEQERLWFLDQLDQQSNAYTIFRPFNIRGEIDHRVLEQSICQLVARHSILRTSFNVIDGQLFQVIHENGNIKVQFIEPPVGDRKERLSAAMRYALEEAHRPFDLTQAPLLRVTLVRIDDREHALLIMTHHIIMDGWSLEIMLKELSMCYISGRASQQASLSPLGLEYADYAVWQTESWNNTTSEKSALYWRQALQGIPPTLALATDHNRPSTQTFGGDHYAFELTKQRVTLLSDLGKSLNCTLFSVLLAAFKVLLYRYTGQSDIIVGFPISNRDKIELEGLIGLFASTLVIRTNCTGNPRFQDLAQSIQDHVLQAYDHAIPFDRLVDLLQPERSRSQNPIFQIMFVYQGSITPTLEIPGLEIALWDIERHIAKFDLSLEISETTAGLRCVIEYNTSLFERERIERLAAHYQEMLHSIGADVATPINFLPFLNEREIFQLLEEFNASDHNQPQDCVHQRILEQARQTPDRIAIVHGQRSITYQELFNHTADLVTDLQHHGIQPRDCVAICLERSPELIIAMVGIMSVGACYLPLDPNYPTDRLSLMLEGADISAVITQDHLSDQLVIPPSRIIVIDRNRDRSLESAQRIRLDHRGSRDDLAYIIYTSGSTGQPRGAAVYQQGLANLIRWYEETFGLSQDDSVLIFTSPSFDLTQKNFFAPLCVGGQVHLAPTDRYDPMALRDYIHHHGITLVNCTPSAFYPLIDTSVDELHQLSGLRYLCLGGEPILIQSMLPWIDSPGFATTIVNTYGPTECSDVVAFHVLDNPRNYLAKPVPIGKPISNSQLFILDKAMELVPIGVPGEIYLGGQCLGMGYVADPAATAAAFVPHPFRYVGDCRLYRTGDIGCYRSDGSIEFLGRHDHQVKVRGFRIELGEIENAMLRYPTIKESVAIVQGQTAGEQQIVAYVVPQPKTTISPATLRDHISTLLPSYMVPSIIIVTHEIPLTPSGKVDRRALSTQDLPAEQHETDVSGLTPLRETLINIWKLLLKRENLTIHDNFFHIGGHSILAAQIITRVRNSFNLPVPLDYMFEAPTIQAFAIKLEQLIHSRNGEQGFSIEPRQGVRVVSFQQERRLNDERRRPNRPRFHVSAAWRIRGDIDSEALEMSLSEIVRRHEILRTAFHATVEECIQEILPPRRIKLFAKDLRAEPHASRLQLFQQYMAEEAWRPFDLSSGELLRCSLVRIDDQEYILLLLVDHIAADGWSMGVIVSELSTLYQAFSSNQPSPLTELSVQYSDFAAWQRQQLQGEYLDRLIQYWQNQLPENLALLLPTDYPRQDDVSAKGEIYRCLLSGMLVEELTRLGQQADATLFMVFLAALKTLFHLKTNLDSIAVVTPSSNRWPIETESMIGNFTNFLILNTDLGGDPTFVEVLARVQKVAIDAYRHQDLPADILKQSRPLHRVRSRVFVGYHSFPKNAFTIPNTTIQSFQVDPKLSTFEIGLSIMAMEDGLSFNIVYKTDLFAHSTIERLAETLMNILRKAVAKPMLNISKFSEE